MVRGYTVRWLAYTRFCRAGRRKIAASRLTQGEGRSKHMARELAERFQRWFEYERDAHAKVLRSLESVPAARRSGPEYEKAVAILAHIGAARRIWLVRLGVLTGPQGTLAPEKLTVAEVADRLQAV